MPDLSSTKLAVIGLTFKNNCPDLRNTRVTDIIDELFLTKKIAEGMK